VDASVWLMLSGVPVYNWNVSVFR